MHRTRLLPLAAASLLFVAATPAAAADRLLDEVPAGSTNLAFGGGRLAWAQPQGDGFRLYVRASAGVVSTPPIDRFATAVDAAIGSTGHDAGSKRLVAVYGRGGDLHQLDLADGGETRVPGASTARYREFAPSIKGGTISFVRSGGTRNGVFVLSRGRLRRITPTVARATATNGTRVAYTTHRAVIVRRISGEGTAMRFDIERPADLQLTRYQAAWRAGDAVWVTERFGGSGRARTRAVRQGRTPEGLVSFAVGQTTNESRYIDDEGLKLASPSLFAR